MNDKDICKRKGSIKSEVIYNKEETHRYLLKRVWKDEEIKKMVSIIMFNPSYANELVYDYTSMKVINYLINQDKYKGVYILNLYSIIETKGENVKGDLKLANIRENDKYIAECLGKSDKVYIAWGTNENNKKRIKQIIKLLKNNNFNEVYKLIDRDGENKHPSRCSIVGEQSVKLEDILG